jgi:hypothetical protein
VLGGGSTRPTSTYNWREKMFAAPTVSRVHQKPLAVESIGLGFGQQAWKNVHTDHALSVPFVEPIMRILCVPAEAGSRLWRDRRFSDS